MKRPQIFNHPVFGEVRSIQIDDKPFFVGNDVAKALEYARPHEAVASHCKGAVTCRILTNGGEQDVKVIPEGDVFRLIYKAADQSRNLAIKEKAERFEKWVFDEVLPTIRKHGAYLTPTRIEEVLLNPDTIIDLAQRLKKASEEQAKLHEKIERDKRYTSFGKIVANSDAVISVGAFAKMVYEKHGINLGRNRLFEWLRKNGYLILDGRERNNPKQRYIEQGLFEVKPTVISRSQGDEEKMTPLITGKGQVLLTEKLVAEFIVQKENSPSSFLAESKANS